LGKIFYPQYKSSSVLFNPFRGLSCAWNIIKKNLTVRGKIYKKNPLLIRKLNDFGVKLVQSLEINMTESDFMGNLLKDFLNDSDSKKNINKIIQRLLKDLGKALFDIEIAVIFS
jgi:hypothetical protein